MSIKKRNAVIYKLTCIINNKIYIGKSVNWKKRINFHKNTHKRSGRSSSYIENAIMKHGWESFKVDILEIFEDFDKSKDNDMLLERESYYIVKYNSTDKSIGYNICKYSTDRGGIPLSEEHKEKIRQGNLGKKMSEHAKEKCSLSKIGKPLSEEHKKKLSLAKLGKKRGPFSEEHKEKIRQGNLGKKMSEESKEKIRQANLGKKLKPETIDRIKRTKKENNFKHSEETKEKIRQTKLRKKER